MKMTRFGRPQASHGKSSYKLEVCNSGQVVDELLFREKRDAVEW